MCPRGHGASANNHRCTHVGFASSYPRRFREHVPTWARCERRQSQMVPTWVSRTSTHVGFANICFANIYPRGFMNSCPRGHGASADKHRWSPRGFRELVPTWVSRMPRAGDDEFHEPEPERIGRSTCASCARSNDGPPSTLRPSVPTNSITRPRRGSCYASPDEDEGLRDPIRLCARRMRRRRSIHDRCQHRALQLRAGAGHLRTQAAPSPPRR